MFGFFIRQFLLWRNLRGFSEQIPGPKELIKLQPTSLQYPLISYLVHNAVIFVFAFEIRCFGFLVSPPEKSSATKTGRASIVDLRSCFQSVLTNWTCERKWTLGNCHRIENIRLKIVGYFFFKSRNFLYKVIRFRTTGIKVYLFRTIKVFYCSA